MKKVVTALFAILFGWNIILTIQVVQDHEDEQGTPTYGQIIANITSDLTNLVEACEPKVVGVVAIADGQELGTGSGVIYRVEGNTIQIVTNHHVIDGADEVAISYDNGEIRAATIKGSDVLSDLALLEATVDFQASAFTIGDSALVKKGEYVIAIGSPLGLDFQGSVTGGIISGVERVVSVDVNDDGYDDWDAIVLQTDAAINPGNSGGALVNMAGELIGINSMKIASSDVEGMGFAIPINEIVPIVEDLAKYGEVRRPFIGISARSISEMSAYEKATLNINPSLNYGLYIADISAGAAADLAGLQIDDILLTFNGTEITSFKEFRQLLYAQSIGDLVTIQYLRDGQEYTTEATLQ